MSFVWPDHMPDRRPYFFDAGIRFACRRCGSCCVGAPGTVFVSHEESRVIAAHLEMDAAQFVADYLYPYKSGYSITEHDDGRCRFFDGGCTIYAVRPNQCRTWPFWFSNMRSERRWRCIVRQCPGIGKGRLFSRAEILAMVRSTMMI
jgi:Fe-S-cluster containining protein